MASAVPGPRVSAINAAAVAIIPSSTIVSPSRRASRKKPAIATISKPPTSAIAPRGFSARLRAALAAACSTTRRLRSRAASSAPAPRPTARSRWDARQENGQARRRGRVADTHLAGRHEFHPVVTGPPRLLDADR